MQENPPHGTSDNGVFEFALLSINFYGERVTVLTDSETLARQLCLNFDIMVLDCRPATLETEADIRATGDRLPDTDASEFATYWSLFSRQFCQVLCHRFVFLHASAIGLVTKEHKPSRRGEQPIGVLFVGPSGCGKTTLAIAGAHLGHVLISDDVVALEWSTGILYGVPFPFRPRALPIQELLDQITRTHRPPIMGTARLRKAFLLGSSNLQSDDRTVVGALLRAVHCPNENHRTLMLHRMVTALAGCELSRLGELPPCIDDLSRQKELLRPTLEALCEGR